MVDLHCHILPGIDDGPRTMSEALALARAQTELGISTVVATPHVNWDYPDNRAERIRAELRLFTDALSAAAIDLEVEAGAELALARAMDLDDAELGDLRLGSGEWLLVECPFAGRPTGFEYVLNALVRRGHRLLLAHPERIAGFAHDRELLRRLVRGGRMAGQLTSGSLAGRFGREAERFSWWLLEERLVHAVASDAHSVDRRPPGNLEPLRQAGLAEIWVEHLVERAPEALLGGDQLPPLPTASPRSGGLRGRLRRVS